jgi:retron-type reverse transcriptase
MEGIKLSRTSEGTLQGRVISPLLANIALHGMEYRRQEAFPIRKPRVKGKLKQLNGATPYINRYSSAYS